ncbi:MAG: endonuclease III, partial [Porticoccaceae bacterium]
MLKKERAAYILAKLTALYPEPAIPLQHKDPYTLLVAVLLSAQCTDERVNKVTPALFALADNPEDMAKVPVEEIHRIIKPCGL